MPVAARQIDWEAWSQSRFLAWAETQPEGGRYEFDGFRPVAMAPATVGHNRIGRNIRAPACRRARHATLMGRRMRSKQLGAPCESRTRSSHVPGRTGTRSPCRRRSSYLRSSRQAGVIGDGTRRRSMSTNRCPRYSAMLSLNPRVDHSGRSGANLVSRRGTGTLPTRPDQFACQNSASSFHSTTFIPGSTSIEAGASCRLVGLRFGSTHARAAVQHTEWHVQSDAGERESPVRDRRDIIWPRTIGAAQQHIDPHLRGVDDQDFPHTVDQHVRPDVPPGFRVIGRRENLDRQGGMMQRCGVRVALGAGDSDIGNVEVPAGLKRRDDARVGQGDARLSVAFRWLSISPAITAWSRPCARAAGAIATSTPSINCQRPDPGHPRQGTPQASSDQARSERYPSCQRTTGAERKPPVADDRVPALSRPIFPTPAHLACRAKGGHAKSRARPASG